MQIKILRERERESGRAKPGVTWVGLIFIFLTTQTQNTHTRGFSDFQSNLFFFFTFRVISSSMILHTLSPSSPPIHRLYLHHSQILPSSPVSLKLHPKTISLQVKTLLVSLKDAYFIAILENSLAYNTYTVANLPPCFVKPVDEGRYMEGLTQNLLLEGYRF